MKSSAVALVLVLLPILSVYGDPSEAAQAFLKVEDSVWSYPPEQMVSFTRFTLPKGVQAAIAGYFGDTTRVIYQGFRYDLNGDGVAEYIIETPAGGSAGPSFVIVTQEAKGWEEIGGFRGGFHLIPGKDGWMSIVGYTRGGGDDYSKFRMEFIEGQYREVWTARFANGHFEEKQINPAESPETPAQPLEKNPTPASRRYDPYGG